MRITSANDVVVTPVEADVDDDVRTSIVQRMRATLDEVVGDGADQIIDDAGIRDRLQWHLDIPEAVVFGAHATDAFVGHLLARIDIDVEDGIRRGLMATIYVAPDARGQGVARRLLHAFEAWCAEQHVHSCATYTAESNAKLQTLLRNRGYTLSLRAHSDDALQMPMVRLEKAI